MSSHDPRRKTNQFLWYNTNRTSKKLYSNRKGITKHCLNFKIIRTILLGQRLKIYTNNYNITYKTLLPIEY